MSSSISGEILNNDDFDVSLFENTDTYLAELVPNLSAMKKSIKKINIYFNRETHTVSKIIITEPSDDYTSIVFYNQKVNIELPDERFEIK